VGIVLAACIISLGFPGIVFGVQEPNDLSGSYYSASGTVTASGPCPAWFTVLDREGTDGGHLTIELNGCTVFDYEIITMEQGAPAGFLAILEPGDYFIVWDEDPGHGSNTDFTFTNDAYEVEDLPEDGNEYIRVSRPEHDDVTNWVVYRVTESGTLTVTNTGLSEHEAIRLTRNIMRFDKYDDVPDGDCRGPGQELTYTICFDNAFGQLLADAFIIDWLPEGVTYPQGAWGVEMGDPNDANEPPFTLLPPDPGYDPETHSYVWPLDDIDPNTAGCVELTVVVNDKAVPGGVLHNVAELWGTVWVSDPNDPNMLYPETLLVARATLDTNVCCYTGIVEELFVDQSAVNGNNTGQDWPNAFLELQDALNYARSSLCAQVHSIYVAQGPYSPGDNTWDTFEIPDGVSVYGGFPKGGSDFWQRNPTRYKTTLSGRIDDTTRSDTVVTMGDESLLDGFTVTESALDGQGIYASEVDFTVANSIVVKNFGYGAFIENCNAVFQWVNFRNNEADGIRHIGEGFTLTVENCWIRQSGRYGMYSLNSTPIVFNSILSESDMANEGREGIRMINPSNQPVLRNMTVSHNRAAGISLAGSVLPEIQNSIVFHNGGESLVGFSADQAAYYSCIEDANSVNYNINVDPQFAYFDPNNVRLSPTSLCLNASNPYLDYSSQLDMDGNPRVYGAAPDMGAYEMFCDANVSHEWDLNADGVINLHEFVNFSRAWLSHDPNDPAWIADPNLADPNLSEGWYEWKHKFNLDDTGSSAYRVDLADLLIFLEEAPWLWTACWRTDLQPEMMMFSFGGVQMKSMDSVISAKAEIQTVQKKSTQEQIHHLASVVVQLENLWLAEPDIQKAIEPDLWNRFMETVYQNLYELATEVAHKK